MSVATDTSKSVQWWRAAKGAKHDGLHAWTAYVARQMATMRMDTRIFVSACSNFNPTGNDEYDYAIRSAFKSKIRDNILAAGVDTAVSMIALARTAPQYLTTAAEWGTSRKAEQRSRVLQTQFYDLGVFDLLPKAFRGGCEGGTGYVVGVIKPDGRPGLERCLHNEVFVDPEDGRYGTPEVIARVRFVPRDALLDQYGSDKALQREIMLAKGPTGQDYMDFFIRRDNKADLVRVVEGWRLPTVNNGDNGVYVKALDNVTLEERRHKKRRHKIVPVLFAERDQGYYGQSLVERMMPAQMQLAETDAYVAKTQALASGAKWFTFQNSGVKPDNLTNAAAQVHEIRDPSLTPVLVSSSATPQDLVQQRNAIKQDAYDAQGFGDNTVTGDVNKGLASGEAVRRADDVKVRRFLNPARLLERSYLGVTRLIEDLNDECAELDPEYEVKSRQRSGRRTWLRTSKWRDLKWEGEDDATVQLFPISAQATTAADKWERVDDWIARGFVSKPQAMDLMEFPDTAAYEELENANLDLVHEQIENLIDLDGAREDMLLPVPYQDLEMAAYIVKNARLVSWRLGAPDEVLDRFERYLSYCQELGKTTAPAASAQAPAPAALNQQAAAAAQLAPQAAAAQPMMTGPQGQA